MGANAVTTVYDFTAGQVLTAAQMDNVNCGIPVFATTTTRDAAFGGTGEKTLAEGQFAYIEATNTTQYYDGAAWQTVGGLAVVKAETAFTAASSITADNVFTSAYTNYKIFIRFTSSTTASMQIRLRVSAVSAATNYNYQLLSGFSASTAAARTTGATGGIIAYGTGGSFPSSTELLLSGPNLAEATSYMANSNSSDGALTAPYVNLWYGNHSTATAYDGIEIFTGSGNLTGTYTIYGLSK